MRLIIKKTRSEAMKVASRYMLQGRRILIKPYNDKYNVYVYARTQTKKRV